MTPNRETEALAISTWVIGAQIFEGHANGMTLAFIFCFAVRNALLDELEGVDQTPEEVWESMRDRIQPPMPAAATDAFKSMMLKDFERRLGHLRSMAVTEQVDLAEYADALENENLRAAINRRFPKG